MVNQLKMSNNIKKPLAQRPKMTQVKIGGRIIHHENSETPERMVTVPKKTIVSRLGLSKG